MLLFQPVAVFASVQFAVAGLLSWPGAVASFLLGASCHLVPLGYFAVRLLARRRVQPA